MGLISKEEQKKRWLNALKQAARINRIQKKGNMILMDGDEIMEPTGRFYLKDNSLVWASSPDANFFLGYFINDSNLHNGMELSIKKYNKTYFGNIKYCEKKHFKKLDEFMKK